MSGVIPDCWCDREGKTSYDFCTPRGAVHAHINTVHDSGRYTVWMIQPVDTMLDHAGGHAGRWYSVC
jgi:hypothetical protein